MRHVLLTDQELEDLQAIRLLLDEAHKRVGTYKSSDGSISVHLGTHTDREAGRFTPTVTIYDYTLGPSRNHYFDSTAEALDTVKQWCKDAEKWSDE